ncbi:MAG: sulfotransferase domain-containing protein [Gammaproteobacteria bacterium]|nr:sulfotransferase domain-containing protein [Gammaproteobacteria bacterium]
MFGIVKSVIRKMLFQMQLQFERTKHWLRKTFSGSKQPDTQLVVCGYPRSGTSLFYNMLSSSLTDYLYTEGEDSSLNNIWKNGNIVTKSPYDTINLSKGRIQKSNYLKKNIYVIIIVRDLRDVITSKHLWAPDDYMIGYDDKTLVITGRYPNYKKEFNGPGIGTYYKAIKNILEMPELKVMLVNYEDLIKDPDSCQKKVGDYFGINFDEKFSDYHLRKEKHGLRYEGDQAPIDSKLHKSSSLVTSEYVCRWRKPEHYERIKSEFGGNDEFMKILIDYGYEKDANWYAEFLNAVQSNA